MPKCKKTGPEQSGLAQEIKRIYKRYRQGFYRPNLLLCLEKRQMFDGAAGAIAADDMLDDASAGSEEQLPTPAADPTTELDTGSADTATADNTASKEPSGGNEVIETELTAGEETVSPIDAETATGEQMLDDPSVVESVQADEVVNEESSTTASKSEPDSISANHVSNKSAGPAVTEAQYTDALDSDSIEESTAPLELVAPEEDAAPLFSTIGDDVPFSDDDSLVEISEVVFIDTAVEGYKDLLNGILGELEKNIVIDNPSPEDEIESLLGGFAYDTPLTGSALDEPEDLPAPQSNTLIADDSYPDQITGSPQTYRVGGALVYLLDTESSAMTQISQALINHEDLAAIHVVSHGSTGQLRLGNETIGSDNLANHADTIAQWGSALNDAGDILLYGCQVGGGGEGQEFLDDIAALTRADISASDDDTGNAQFGGDWDLEVDIGPIETEELLNDFNATAFAGVLGTDGDGIPDATDLDDDNDGIMDIVENGSSVSVDANGNLDNGQVDFSNFVQVSTTEVTGEINGIEVTITTDGNSIFSFRGGDLEISSVSDTTSATVITFAADVPFLDLSFFVNDFVDNSPQRVTTFESFTADGVSSPPTSVSAGDDLLISGAGAGTVVSGNGRGEIFFTDLGAGTGASTVSYVYNNVGTIAGNLQDPIVVEYLSFFGARDSDGDGVLNSQDLDSDNDGISDLLESGIDASFDTDGN
ncbi:MAG: DUF4347 domain-containing protein, partial [Rhodothermales bacterium]|nr:DUF4347 domain-containing protein [Rhodothermales bacterium]